MSAVAPVAVASRGMSRSAALVVGLMLAQVTLFVWMAPRGFELTDEAFYLLNYAHWRELSAMVSFFGAYFDLPFRAFGESVAAIRIFGLALMLLVSAYCAVEALRFNCGDTVRGQSDQVAIIATAMAGALYYYSDLKTLRAPSYNMQALVAMLAATGLLFRLMRPAPTTTSTAATSLLYGVALGACAMGKASAALAMLVAHLVYFAGFERDWRVRRLLTIVLAVTAGVALNLVALYLMHPPWFMQLREGLTIMSLYGRNLLALATNLRWDVKMVAIQTLPWLAPAAVAYLAALRLGRGNAAATSAATIVLIFAINLVLLWQGQGHLWLPMMSFAALLLCAATWVLYRRPQATRQDLAPLATTALLLALPLGFSFGTSGRMLEHSQTAGAFGTIAIVIQLATLRQRSLLSHPALMLCLMALCLPTLTLQVRAALDKDFTYRQHTGLGAQRRPIQIGAAGNTLLVDDTSERSIRDLLDAAHQAGFKAGTPVLDFTGDGPGLVYALGGRPVGLAWLLGGGPGGEAAAAHVVAQAPQEVLRRAWILSSTNNPYAIKTWTRILDDRLGAASHVAVADLGIPAWYRWKKGAPEINAVTLWRPNEASR